MEQENKELSRLKRFDDLAKDLQQRIMELDGLQCFAEFCKNGKKDSLSLDNPANQYGHVSIPVNDALTYIGKEMQTKMREAQETAEQLKDILCFGGFEDWNRADAGEVGNEERKNLTPDGIIVFVRDELEQVVNGWCRRFGANEEDVWEAVRYWGKEWSRLLEGREKARRMKVGDRLKYVRNDKAEDNPDAPSNTGRTGIVEDIAFSRSHGDIATVKMDDDGSTLIFKIKYLELIKRTEA